jgi:hypothetical protein
MTCTPDNQFRNGLLVARGEHRSRPNSGPNGVVRPPGPVRHSRDVFGEHREALATSADAHPDR